MLDHKSRHIFSLLNYIQVFKYNLFVSYHKSRYILFLLSYIQVLKDNLFV
jgi:hypothetical protein